MLTFNQGTVSIIQSNFTSNKVGGLGGVFFYAVEDAQISQCRFSYSGFENTNANSFVMSQLAQVNISECTFEANSGVNGGAVGLYNSTVAISNSQFSYVI